MIPRLRRLSIIKTRTLLTGVLVCYIMIPFRAASGLEQSGVTFTVAPFCYIMIAHNKSSRVITGGFIVCRSVATTGDNFLNIGCQFYILSVILLLSASPWGEPGVFL